MRKLLLAGMVSFALVGFGGVALADDDPTTPPSEPTAPTSTSEPTSSSSAPAEAPPAPPAPKEADKPPVAEDPEPVEEPAAVAPKVSVRSSCAEGLGFVDVVVTRLSGTDVDNVQGTEVTYEVKLFKFPGLDKPVQTGTKSIPIGETRTVRFDKLAAGEYRVVVTGDDGTSAVKDLVGQSEVDRCAEVGPIDDPMQVFVRCVDGEGVVTIRLFNSDGKVETYTITIEDFPAIEFPVGEDVLIVRVLDEEPLPDGSFKVRVQAEAQGIDHSETVTVACAPPPTTTTTPPPPQARPAPASNSGGLASTGAAVGGLALLGLLALALGGGFVVASRRRRIKPAEGTDG